MPQKSTSVAHAQGCAADSCESGILSQKATTTLPKCQRPHKWNKAKDAPCCIACERPFKRGDSVYTDCAVNLHVECLPLYQKQLKELGLTR